MGHHSIPHPLKCIIKNLDDGETVTAYFNPKEIAIDKKVPWNKHKTPKADNPVLEFTDAEPKELSIELLFDGYEQREDVHATYIKKLESFALIQDDKTKRPPMCIFLWGKFPSFMGVIESVSTKYTMFLPNGTPVRATAQIKMKQADTFTKGTPGDKERGGAKRKATNGGQNYLDQGTIATQEHSRRADMLHPDHRKVLDANGSETGHLGPGSHVEIP